MEISSIDMIEKNEQYEKQGFVPFSEFIEIIQNYDKKLNFIPTTECLKLYDSLTAGVLVFKDTNIIYSNKSVNSILMIDEELLTLALIKEMVFDEDKPIFDKIISKASEVQERIVLRIKLSSNIIKWVRFSVSMPLLRSEVILLVVLEDVSDMMKANLQQELISKMMIDTEKKQNNSGVLLEKTAKYASVGIITSGITHEINQPLNAIKVGSDGLMIWNSQHPGMFPEKIAKVINAISISASKIDNILKHLRSYWIDSELSIPNRIELREVIQKAIEIMSQKINSHDIKLNLKLSEEPIYVHYSSVNLELIINNLIISSINSLDNYPEKSDKFIQIDLVSEANAAYISITDNGSDVNILNSELISEPSINKNISDNNSIELAIVKLLLNEIDTQISISNFENQGAVITLKINTIV